MKGILLIAEQPSILRPFTDMLSPAYDVRCVHTEEEGLQALSAPGNGIVAVLIELALARRGGFSIADRLRQRSRFFLVPMIAISAALPEARDMDCIEHGFFDLLSAKAPRQLVYKRISNAIQASDSLSLVELERMLKALPACIFLKDTEGRYVFSTQYWRHLDTHGDPDWTIRGKTDLDVRRDRQNALKAMESDRRILETGEGTDYIIEENEDGVREYLQLIKRPVRDESGAISGIIALINNVTEYQLLKMELEKRARTDTLTGLLNKSSAEDLMRMMVDDTRKKGGHSALLMIDLDHFKQINDTFGHAEGDRVLCDVGRVIRNNCRSMDVAGRVGGDEFAVLMRSITGPDNAGQLAERLLEQVAEAFRGDRLEGCVSLSIGVAICPEHGSRYDELFRAADEALYLAKTGGRHCYRLFAAGNGE